MANRTHEAVAHAEIHTELREQLEQLARSNDRTLAAEIRRALREHVQRERATTPEETHE
jgi:predicted transcriptional regulator